jgi:tetratricopeptide (TPR) repeat protein
MNLAESYRLLGLTSGASFADIKASYRRLARLYHPDMSSGGGWHKDKFIEITTAYKSILGALSEPQVPTNLTPNFRPKPAAGHHQHGQQTVQQPAPQPVPSVPRKPETLRKAVQLQENPSLSIEEQRFKVESYRQLQQFLRTQRYPRAIALIEGLARRLPRDSEVSQWQAIVYQQWGQQLIRDRQPDKARLYLKKALSTDPQNRSLWAQVEKDFQAIEQLF